MTLVNADGGLAEMSGNGMRCLAWVAARAGLAPRRRTPRRHRGRPPRRSTSNATTARSSARHVVHGSGNVRARAHSGRRRLAVRSRCGRRRRGVSGRRGRDGKSPLRRCSSTIRQLRPSRRTGRNWSTTGASRAARTSSSWPRPGPIAWRCGCGSGAWGRRCRAAPARAQPRPWPTAAASSGEHVQVDVAGGTLFVMLGDTVVLGGPVVHVFDVDLPREQLRQALARESSAGAAGRQRRRLTATEVDLERPPQRALLVGTGYGTTSVEEAEASLDELAQLTDTAGADAVDRVLQRRTHTRPGDLHRQGQGRGTAPARRSARRRRRDLRRRAHARAATQPREDLQRRRRRPRRARSSTSSPSTRRARKAWCRSSSRSCATSCRGCGAGASS